MDSRLVRTVLERATSATPEALTLLERLVNIDSPSSAPGGTTAVQTVMAEQLERLGFSIRWHAVGSEDGRFALEANYDTSSSDRVTLMGHVDTVFPIGTAARRPFSVVGKRAHGPGVSDMKAGLALMTAAAAALVRGGALDAVPSVRVVLTSDEELGTPYSKEVIRELVDGSRCVLNCEPGRHNGAVVTSRRGSAHLLLETTGVEAHSGTDFLKGRSAVVSLARGIVELEALNQLPGDQTINVGLVSGGTATNVVPGHAAAKVHVTFSEEDAGEATIDLARAAVARAAIPGTRAELTGGISFLPMPATLQGERLFDTYRDVTALLGLQVTSEHARGAADSGIPASMGIPTLCGVGPAGANWHSDAEYMELEGFDARAAALALTMIAGAGQR